MEIFCIYFQDLWRIYFIFLMQSKIFNPWKTLLEEGYNFRFEEREFRWGTTISNDCVWFSFLGGGGEGDKAFPLDIVLALCLVSFSEGVYLFSQRNWSCESIVPEPPTMVTYVSVVLSVHVKNHCICLVAFSMIIFRYTKLKGITILWTRLPLPYLSCSLIFLISILSFNLSITANLSYASAFHIEKWLPSQVSAPFRVSFPALHLAVFLVSF